MRNMTGPIAAFLAITCALAPATPVAAQEDFTFRRIKVGGLVELIARSLPLFAGWFFAG